MIHIPPEVRAAVQATSDWKNCPRCSIPMNPRDHPALSRTDDKTHVCGRCGMDEAIEVWANGSPTPRAEWPIEPTIHTTLSDGNVTFRRPIPKPRNSK